MKLIDLTHALNANTPVYPGDPPILVEAAGVISKDGFADHKLSFGTHVGTHLDAPAHMITNAKTLKDFSIDRLVLKATCINAINGFDADVIRSANLGVGMAVLFYTGASGYYRDDKYWHDYPVLSQDCCQALIEAKVGLVGVDTGSVDNAEDFPVHKSLLGADILIIENLTNLSKVAGQTFELMALPLKLEDDGAPARVVAKL